MIVKVNPKDVTSIPSDYNFAKGRCCRYEVVEEYGGTDVQRFEAWSASVADWDSEEEYCSDCGFAYNECECEYSEEPDEDSSQCPDDDEGFDPEFTPSENMEDLTNPIRRARLAAGLTAMEVAGELGITPNAFYHQEREGAHPKPSVVGQALSVIQKLASERGEA